MPQTELLSLPRTYVVDVLFVVSAVATVKAATELQAHIPGSYRREHLAFYLHGHVLGDVMGVDDSGIGVDDGSRRHGSLASQRLGYQR